MARKALNPALVPMRDELNARVSETSAKLREWNKYKGPTGLTPDHIKTSPEYAKALRDYNAAFNALRTFNSKAYKI